MPNGWVGQTYLGGAPEPLSLKPVSFRFGDAGVRVKGFIKDLGDSSRLEGIGFRVYSPWS